MRRKPAKDFVCDNCGEHPGAHWYSYREEEQDADGIVHITMTEYPICERCYELDERATAEVEAEADEPPPPAIDMTNVVSIYSPRHKQEG
jgi:hypothetical protein